MPVPKDDSYVAQYMRGIENPDSIGFKDGKWFQSPRRGDDPNNRGFGVDVKYNANARNLTKGRKGKWLTEEEERALRNQHIGYSMGILDKWTPKILATPPSEQKKAMATGMVYRGDGVKSILNNPALRDAFYAGSDADFQKAVSDFYKSKRLTERANNHNQFIQSISPQAGWQSSEFKPKTSFSEGGRMYYDDLPLSAKADIIRIGVKNGIYSPSDIRTAYNRHVDGLDIFGEGGIMYPDQRKAKAERFGRFLAEGGSVEDEEVNTPVERNSVPTLAAFMQHKADSTAQAAAQHIQQQKAPNVPKLPSRAPWSVVAGILGMSDEERIRLFGTTDPQTCIYTATSQYNDKGALVSGNKTFRKNPVQYGFVEVPMDSARVGDLIQMTDMFGTPHHSTIMTGKDENGRPLLSYSNGSSHPYETYFNNDTQRSDTVWTMNKNAPINLFTGGDYGDTPAAFRYQGSPQQRQEWKWEYNEKYKQPLFDLSTIREQPVQYPVEQPDATRVEKPQIVYPVRRKAKGGGIFKSLTL